MRRCFSRTVRRCASLGCAVKTSSTVVPFRISAKRTALTLSFAISSKTTCERARLQLLLARVVATPARAVVLLGEIDELEVVGERPRDALGEIGVELLDRARQASISDSR